MRSKELINKDLLTFNDLTNNNEIFKREHQSNLKKAMLAGSTVNESLLNGKPQGSLESYNSQKVHNLC